MTAAEGSSPAEGVGADGTTVVGDRHFDWNVLVDCLIHPADVMIIEALWWIGRPASPTDMSRMMDEPEEAGYNLSLIAYHARRLAEGGILGVAEIRSRGRNFEIFYDLNRER